MVLKRQKHAKELIKTDVSKTSSVYLDGSLIPNFKKYTVKRGHSVAQLVEALRQKLESRGFDSRWDPSGHTMATQPLTEMSTRNSSWGVKAVDA
jgi:hypothetical protein